MVELVGFDVEWTIKVLRLGFTPSELFGDPFGGTLAGTRCRKQLGRTLAELDIVIICANSSQAKSRVERVNRSEGGTAISIA